MDKNVRISQVVLLKIVFTLDIILSTIKTITTIYITVKNKPGIHRDAL